MPNKTPPSTDPKLKTNIQYGNFLPHSHQIKVKKNFALIVSTPTAAEEIIDEGSKIIKQSAAWNPRVKKLSRVGKLS